MAFSLGLASLPSIAKAQYNATPYGNGSLAPSGYAVNEPIYGQPSYIPQVGQPFGQQYSYQQPAQPQPYGFQAQMVAYPQEPIAAPSVNAQQAPQQGWVGPNNGQYQPTQSGQYSVVPAPQAQPQYVPQPIAAPQAAPMANQQVGPGCGAGVGYSVDPAYANAIAPSAMSGGCASGNCGGGAVYGAPVYGAPAYGGPVYGGQACGPVYAAPGVGGGFGHFGGGRLAGLTAVPGKAYFAGGGALLFRRVDDRNVGLTYDTAMPSENALTTRDARQVHLPGFEVFAGRYLNCGRNAIVLNYWGLFPEEEMATIVQGGPGSYRSRMLFNGVTMPLQNVYDWYDAAVSHQVTRSSRYHNFEANLLGFAVGGAARSWNSGAVGGGACGSGYGSCGDCSDCGSCGSGCASFTGPCGLTPNMCGSRLNWTWLAGFRWFRFTDKLQYSASEVDAVYNGGADDLYYDNNVRNDLVGFQLGGAGTYCLGRRLNLYALSKAGVYNNHSQLYTRIGRNGGTPTTATIVSPNIYNGQNYMVDASQNNAAFLGELGAGVGMRISRGWSANVGYRVLGASGVATAVNTIPFEMNHLGNVAEYNNTSSLFLHGITLGGMYNF